MADNGIIAKYPNATYLNRGEREAEKRLQDAAIANAAGAMVAAQEIVSQVADVAAESVNAQVDVNPDYAAKVAAEQEGRDEDTQEEGDDGRNDGDSDNIGGDSGDVDDKRDTDDNME